MAWQPPPNISLEEAYHDIASKITPTTWKRFVRSALKLHQNDIDKITAKYSNSNAKEMKYEMFIKWQEKVGSAASVETAYAMLNHFLFPKVCPKPDLTVRAPEQSPSQPFDVDKPDSMPSSSETSKATCVPDALPFVDSLLPEQSPSKPADVDKPDSMPSSSETSKATCVPDALPFVDSPPFVPLAPIENYCTSIEDVIVTPTDRQFYVTTQQQTGSTYPIVNRIGGRPGCTFILNNMFTHLREQDGDRTGSEKDLRIMRDLWERLGSEVFVYEDLNARDIERELKIFSRHCGGYDYCTIFIMSHGTSQNRQEIVYGNDHVEVLVDDILKIFNNVESPHLQGIPKLFFFQCCRGDEPDSGVASSLRPLSTSSTRADGNYVSDSSPVIPMLPQSSDILVAHATHLGFQAVRNIDHGSWFVNAIGNVFMRHARNEHAVDLMTMVHNAVSTQTTSIAGGLMAMPEATTSLRKKLYFYPGI